MMYTPGLTFVSNGPGHLESRFAVTSARRVSLLFCPPSQRILLQIANHLLRHRPVSVHARGGRGGRMAGGFTVVRFLYAVIQ